MSADESESEGDDPSAFDSALENVTEINDRLAESEAIGTMQFHGRAGFHLYVTSDAGVDSLWRVALLAAVDDLIEESVWVDEPESVDDAVRQVERQLGDVFDLATAENVADQFEEKLQSFVEAGGEN